MLFLTQHLDAMIIGVLGTMSFIMLTFTLERILYYRRININEFSQFESLQVALTQNLTSIASIGYNAPYVGLLGTVVGILITFNEMGTSGNINVNKIMVGLAMALKATAGGLLVAIPAVLFYNALTRKTETIIAEWKSCRVESVANCII